MSCKKAELNRVSWVEGRGRSSVVVRWYPAEGFLKQLKVN
jgi:hypothetical protein